MQIGNYIDKIEGFDSLSQNEQIKFVSYFYSIVSEKNDFTPSEIRDCFSEEHLKVPTNVAQYFPLLSSGKTPVFVKKGKTYTFHRNAKKELDAMFFGNKSSQTISLSFQSLTSKVTSKEQKTFLEEAISCFEIKCFRASIIMTWLLAIDILYEYVLNNHLPLFNNSIQVHGKYKKIIISKKEDFSDIKESDFIELLRVGKVISGDVKKILEEKLSFRNTVAHPNTISVKESKAISFIEDLIENVITKFQ